MQNQHIFAEDIRLPDTEEHTGYKRFMDACRLRQPDATPIWFMRQAGRSATGYQDIRKQHDVLTLIKTPELSAQLTVLPVTSFGVDAAVLYADILMPLEGMGIDLELRAEGPIIHNPLRTQKDIDALRIIDTEETAPYIFESLQLVQQELTRKQAIIGSVGAPFTQACYMIEGKPSREYATAKALMYSQPVLWHRLMDKITTVTINYALAQLKAGADVIQIFDSWAGTLSPTMYRRFVLSHMQRLFKEIQKTGAPSIHFSTGNPSLLENMVEAGGDVIGIDWRIDLDDAWARVGYNHGIQGNLDPMLLLTSWSHIEASITDILQRAAGRPGHIFNLGHGIPATADPTLLQQLVEAVHTRTKREGQF